MNGRVNVAVFASGLLLAITNHHLRFEQWPWSDGLMLFFGSWLAHSLGVAFLGAAVAFVRPKIEPLLLPEKRKSKHEEVDMNETLVLVSIVVAVSCLALLFVFVIGFPPYDEYDDGPGGLF